MRLIIRLLLLLIFLFLEACADPQPIKDGAKVPTPWQCIEAHKRGEVNC